jgi:hypothetical protein
LAKIHRSWVVEVEVAEKVKHLEEMAASHPEGTFLRFQL